MEDYKPRTMADIKQEKAQRRRRRAMRCRRGMLLALLAGAIVAVFVLSGCSTDDERDVCCEGVEIDFRYSRGGGDLFLLHISSMYHLLFDAQGLLQEEIQGKPGDLQRLKFDKLVAGKYSLVSLGNMGVATHLGDLRVGVTRRTDIELRLRHLRADGVMANGDPLYWGVLNFVAERNRHHRYLCDMSNIHCRLTVTIRWRGKQPVGNEPFTLQLRDVPGLYSMDKDKAYAILVAGNDKDKELVTTPSRVVHSFPWVQEAEERELLVHRIEAPRLAGRVKARFVTLRYTDHRIPLFRLFRGTQPVMKEIDLSKPFKAWHWAVSRNIEQDYDIEIELLDDGTVIVSPGGEAKVLDWVDGGSV